MVFMNTLPGRPKQSSRSIQFVSYKLFLYRKIVGRGEKKIQFFYLQSFVFYNLFAKYGQKTSIFSIFFWGGGCEIFKNLQRGVELIKELELMKNKRESMIISTIIYRSNIL